ncbi:MAG: hypothetical protein IPG86_14570 [Chitinophagaceae bacterium]|nr:hypothetical protein [Chitinophagaceae bacterium]
MKTTKHPLRSFLLRFVLCFPAMLFAGYGLAQKEDSIMVNIWADKLFCKTEMEDAIADGKGNEAFVQYHWAIVDANNGALSKNGIQSNLDIKMLFSGNNYPLNKMIFGEKAVRENEILVIIPVVWEQDKTGPDVVKAFNQNMVSCMNMIASQLPAKYAPLRTNYSNSIAGYYNGISADVDKVRTLSWNSFSGLPSFKTLLEHVRGSGATRPVGISSNFEFTPAIFTFSRASMRYLEYLAFSNSGSAMAKFQANYVEEVFGDPNNRPSYTVFISLQKKPIYSSVINPPPPVVPPPYQVGIWEGSWDGLADPFFKMKISADGFFQLYDYYNTARQSGTYTMTNDQFSGKITLNSKKYELTGNLNRTAGTLSGSWKYNDGFTAKSGTWSLRKQ